jgi:hypothetical protein
MDWTKERLLEYASRYRYAADPTLQDSDFLSYRDFITICGWKSQRPHHHVRKNTEQTVSVVTRAVRDIDDDTGVIRLRLLQVFDGVGLPTASALLHLGLPHLKFPLIDQRAWWSLYGEEKATFDEDDWLRYVIDCRNLADRLGVSMRELDRGLWQYSAEHQGILAGSANRISLGHVAIEKAPSPSPIISSSSAPLADRGRGTAGSKYGPLCTYLSVQVLSELTLTFDEIEQIIGAPLPKSADTPQWWANVTDPQTSHVQRHAWREAGYDAFLMKDSRKAIFRRVRA